MTPAGRTVRGLLLFAFAAAALLACRGALTVATEPLGQPVAFATLAQTAVPGQSGGAVEEVARDPAAYQALWARLTAGSPLAKTPPAVDFSRQMVVAVALATQGCVAKVTIQGIVRDASGLRVDVREQYPGPQCRCVVASRPFHVVALDRRADPVRFSAARGPNTC